MHKRYIVVLVVLLVLMQMACNSILGSSAEAPQNTSSVQISSLTPDELDEAVVCYGCTTVQRAQSAVSHNGKRVSWFGNIHDIRTDGTAVMWFKNLGTINVYGLAPSNSFNVGDEIKIEATVNVIRSSSNSDYWVATLTNAVYQRPLQPSAYNLLITAVVEEYNRSGRQIVYTVTVENNSNENRTVYFSGKAQLGGSSFRFPWSFHPGDHSVTLEPGENKIIVRVRGGDLSSEASDSWYRDRVETTNYCIMIHAPDQRGRFDSDDDFIITQTYDRNNSLCHW